MYSTPEAELVHERQIFRDTLDRQEVSHQASLAAKDSEIQSLRAELARVLGRESRQAALSGTTSEILDRELKSSREERGEILTRLTRIECLLERVSSTYEDVAVPRSPDSADVRSQDSEDPRAFEAYWSSQPAHLRENQVLRVVNLEGFRAGRRGSSPAEQQDSQGSQGSLSSPARRPPWLTCGVCGHDVGVHSTQGCTSCGCVTPRWLP